MNREIKFRGKSVMDNTYGNWLYSSGIKYGDDVELMYCDEDTSEEWHYIDKNTLGQYTGLHDKNGKEIYEGDILKSIRWNDIYLVKQIGTAYYLCRKGKNRFNKITTWNNAEKSEVIGNIYDNSELLGRE